MTSQLKNGRRHAGPAFLGLNVIQPAASPASLGRNAVFVPSPRRFVVRGSQAGWTSPPPTRGNEEPSSLLRNANRGARAAEMDLKLY